MWAGARVVLGPSTQDALGAALASCASVLKVKLRADSAIWTNVHVAVRALLRDPRARMLQRRRVAEGVEVRPVRGGLAVGQLVNLRVEELLELGELDFDLVDLLLLLDELLLVLRLELLNGGLDLQVSVEQVGVLLLYLFRLLDPLLRSLLHQLQLLLQASLEL